MLYIYIRTQTVATMRTEVMMLSKVLLIIDDISMSSQPSEESRMK